jgi:hypothetical protein
MKICDVNNLRGIIRNLFCLKVLVVKNRDYKHPEIPEIFDALDLQLAELSPLADEEKKAIIKAIDKRICEFSRVSEQEMNLQRQDEIETLIAKLNQFKHYHFSNGI